MDSLRRLVQEIRRSGASAERSAGLSGAQLFVLQQLGEGPAASLNELAERTHTHQSSVSVVVSRLVERGLVSRKPSETDRRRLVLSLTPRGRALRRRAPEAIQARMIAAIEGLGARDRRALDRGLAAFVAAMGARESAAPLFFEDGPRPRAAKAAKHAAKAVRS